MSERAMVIRLNPDRLDEELARPDFTALLAKGYTVAATFPAEERGKSYVLMLMVPPPPVLTPAPTPAGRDWPMWAWLVLAVLWLVSTVAVQWAMG